MLKQLGGKRHTGFWNVAKRTGALHVRPRSRERPRAARRPRLAAVGGAAEQERDAVRGRALVAEAREVRRAVGPERDRGVAAEIVDAGAGDEWVVRVLGDAGDETVRQRLRPR